ncbi:MAG: hypothetical protein M1404_02695 [Acidobacteria bacterium]|nr:hypothetical protein [Acidobacteriota bacterium]
MQTLPPVKPAETARQPLLSSLARKAFSLPVLLGVLLVAGACIDRYVNVANIPSGTKGYSAYCFDGDQDWHVAVGERILRTHSWPTHDIYSFTAPGTPWIAYEWLGEIVMAVAWRLAGTQGLMLLLAIMASAVMLLLYYYAWLRTRNSLAAFVACALVLPLAALNSHMRPETAGYALLILTLILIEAFRQGHTNALWGLPIIFLVWTNTHGTFVLGFVVLGAYWVCGIREWKFGNIVAKPWSYRERLFLALAFFLSLVACTITPYRTQVAAYPLEMQFFQSFQRAHVLEWRSFPLGTAYGHLLLGLLLLFLVANLVRKVTYDFADVVLFFAALTETLLHARFIILLVPVFTPLLAQSVAQWIPRRPLARERFFLNFALIAVTCWVVIFFFPSRARLHKAGELLNPVRAVRYLNEHPVPQPMFNLEEWGGYLIKNSWPEHRVFVDGRLDIYDYSGVLFDYLCVISTQPNVFFLLHKYHIRSCLIPPTLPLATLLEASRDWKEVYRDKTSVIFAKVKNPPRRSFEAVRR